MSKHINRLLTDFGNALGLDGLALDENGYCCLSFDEVMVNIESVGESSLVLLYSSLGTLSEGGQGDACRRLLEANYFFQSTAGATVGLDGATGNVALTRVVDTQGVEVLDWEAALQGFVNAAEYCATLVNPEAAGTAARAAPAEQFIRG